MEASEGDDPWNTNEPSDNGDCVKIWFKKNKFVFDDIECNVKRKIGYICERLVECNDKNGPTTRLSTTQALPVTSEAKQSTLATQQQSTEAESTEGPTTNLSTTQTLPVTSAAKQSTLATQQQSTEAESTVSTEGHTTRLSTTRVLPVTSAAKQSTLATQQQSTEAESTASTEGPTTSLSTTQTLPVTSAAKQSTLATQQQSTEAESTVSTEGQTFRFGCSNYTFHDASDTVSYSWKESKILCENGSKLVSLENLPVDRREFNFLQNKITQASKTEFQYYIGLKKDNGKWKWISNNSTMEASEGDDPWNTNEPSDNGDCVKIWFNKNKFVFDDIECNVKRKIGYICERLVECNDKNGNTARLSTTQALPITSEAKQSTLATQQQSTEVESTVSTEATLTDDTFDESPDVKATKNSSFLILIILSLLAVIILAILIIFFVLFARRRRSNKAKASLLREQSGDRDHYLHSSSELTVHFSMSRPEEGLSTLKTVSESKEEYTYAVVDKSKRKSRCNESSNFGQGGQQQTTPDDRHFTSHPVLVESEERIEKTTDKEDRKGHVYAVVHIQQAAVCRDPALQEENVDASYAPNSTHEGGAHAELLNSSSLGHGKEVTSSEAADGQNKCEEYLYADYEAVDKASKKQRPPQMPSPYRGLVYADMSHLPEKNTGNINRANAPTVYAAICHQKTEGAKSRLPKESADQETTYNNNEL